MMKDTHESLIWKYIDGLCDENEVNEVKSLTTADPLFCASLSEAKQLHSALTNPQIAQTPTSMSENVLTQIADLNQSEVGRGIGIQPLLIFMLSLITFSIVSIYIGIDSTKSVLANLEDFLRDDFGPIQSFVASLSDYSLYIFLTLVVIFFLHAWDRFLQKREVSPKGFIAI